MYEHVSDSTCVQDNTTTMVSEVHHMYMQKLIEVTGELVTVYESLDPVEAAYADMLQNIFTLLELIADEHVHADVSTEHLKVMCHEVLLVYKTLLHKSTENVFQNCQRDVAGV